jgi:hypothetical protein
MSGMNPVPGRSIISETGGKDHCSSYSKEPYPHTPAIDVGHGFNLQK